MEMFPSPAPGESDDDAEPPDVPDLPLNLRLQYELQAAGHAISGDPLAPFRELMERCRIDRAPVPLSPRNEGRDLYVAGMVNQIEPAALPSPEEPSVWLDFDGTLVAVSASLFEAHRQELRGNEPLMIGGIVACRDNICFLNAHTIATLMKTHQQASQARQIVLDLENQNKYTVRTLRQICGQFPGPTPVVVVHYESSGRFSLHKLESSRVTVCPPLMNNFRKVLTGERVRVLGYGEE